MIDINSNGTAAGLVIAFLVTIILTVAVLIKCAHWGPALCRKAQSLSRSRVVPVPVRKRTGSDPPESSLEV